MVFRCSRLVWGAAAWDPASCDGPKILFGYNQTSGSEEGPGALKVHTDGTALHASWWNKHEGQVRYAACDNPDRDANPNATNICTDKDNWRKVFVDRDVPAATQVTTTHYGANIVASWIDLDGKVRLGMPIVPTPTNFSVWPAANGVRGSWDSLSFVNGYQLLKNPTDTLFWDSMFVYPDPFLSTADINVNNGVSRHVIKGFQSNGRYFCRRPGF